MFNNSSTLKESKIKLRNLFVFQVVCKENLEENIEYCVDTP